MRVFLVASGISFPMFFFHGLDLSRDQVMFGASQKSHIDMPTGQYCLAIQPVLRRLPGTKKVGQDKAGSLVTSLKKNTNASGTNLKKKE